MEKIAVFSVVYPEVEKYFSDFFKSLEIQTFSNFELVLFNDGFKNLDKYISNSPIKKTVISCHNTWSNIRIQGIKWLYNNDFDYVVFADADDYSSSNRIQIVTDLLSRYDLVCNDFHIFRDGENTSIPFLSKRLKEGDSVTAKSIFDKNILGSNVGARMDAIISVLEYIPADVIAFDWLLFSLSLLQGANCIFTDKTHCYYRQHPNNVASLLDVTNQQITKGVMVKKQHYTALGSKYIEYKEASNQFTEILNKMQDNEYAELYCRAVREKLPMNQLWWEMIKTEKELGLC